MQIYKNYYREELLNPETQYFILDTKGTKLDYEDVEFISYDWSPSRYNRVKVGDLFLYRRPQSSSEIRNNFYFFGAGKISRIEKINDDLVRGFIEKPLEFEQKLLQIHLNNFQWSFKKRKGQTWSNFFNQYGMNKVHKEDFLNILNCSLHLDIKTETEINNGLLPYFNSTHYITKDFSTEDQKGISNIRRGQQRLSELVKRNYNYKCAISGINTKEFLIASHIVPWSHDNSIRLDPANCICLSVLFDKAFDKGYITILESFEVLVSKKVTSDSFLSEYIVPFNGTIISTPFISSPNKEYLRRHNNEIFLDKI
ncbi:hypothetical protein DH09_19610 [Bacillaceae bacterium JMAK1]|nr:hypothetical protein DH09_19610 [Bacillaceae bacterium JMAK1]